MHSLNIDPYLSVADPYDEVIKCDGVSSGLGVTTFDAFLVLWMIIHPNYCYSQTLVTSLQN